MVDEHKKAGKGLLTEKGGARSLEVAPMGNMYMGKQELCLKIFISELDVN